MKHNPLPLGTEDFRELVTHQDSRTNPYLYIDKSEFIQEVWDNSAKIALITRLRKFGKTLNVSMLQHFFAQAVLAIPTKGLFEDIKITQYPEIMKLQGQFPVIFLTLKDLPGASLDSMIEVFQNTIKARYAEQRYLLQESVLLDEEIQDFRAILAEKARITNYTRARLKLSRYIFQVKGEKVMNPDRILYLGVFY